MSSAERETVQAYWVRQFQQHADRCAELGERMAHATCFADVDAVAKEATTQIERMRCDVQLLRHGAWHEMETAR